MDGPGHLLSLKVMRVSRPALATAWEPFYSSSPSFSAHSTASVLSLQEKTPLPGHPKTLRDLTNASQLLTLPSSFGAIQLGETFSGALAVNNETAASVDGVLLRVEMQTASNKILIAELGGPLHTLAAGDTMETVVHHEIKELGQHVLACTVTYNIPPGAFRKFYKFAVTNPLSVKTKVHIPRSPSANFSRIEREKVFLEIHIQNLTPEPMWLERMVLDPAPGWQVQDVNFGTASDGKSPPETIFSGSMAVMQPQDARQCIYILSTTQTPSFAVKPAPGAIIPLGKLDISWRSSFGEPGRLLTSMLSRRMPSAPSAPILRQPTASALPLHLQRSSTIVPSSQPPSRPGTPPIASPVPYKPASPRIRPGSLSQRPQTPVTFTPPTNAIATNAPQPTADPLEVDLVVRDIPRGDVAVDKPFVMKFTVGVAAPKREGRRRVITLAVQHVQAAPAYTPAATSDASPASPRPGHANLATVTSPLIGILPLAPSQGQVLEDRSPVTSPRQHLPDREILKALPRPVPELGSEDKYLKTEGASFLGFSVQALPPIMLVAPSAAPENGKQHGDEGATSVAADRVEGFVDFELTWVPMRTGFVRVGGVRLLVVEDSMEETAADGPTSGGAFPIPLVLKEWDVVGEVWVS